MFGIGTVIMAAFSPPHEVPLVGARLLLASFFFYFMFGLRFRVAARSNLIVFAALVVAFLAGTMPTATATYLMALLLTANIIGIAGSYALEHANRTAFLEHRQLTEVATHDGLTTLLNRAAFEDQIRRVWQQAQRDRQTVAVIMIDIDYFKAYNDRYGHIAGDDCLRRVSSALRDAARRRPLDFVARYGGEELVAVLYGADKSYGESISRSLLTAVRDLRIPHANSETQPYVTVSVGVVSVDAYRIATHDAAVGLADQALYAAKHQGRDRYVAMEYGTNKLDPAATTVLPLRETSAFREGPVVSRFPAPAPAYRYIATSFVPSMSLAAEHPLAVELEHDLAARIDGDHAAVAAERLHLREHVAHRLRQRQLQVLHLRADVVRHHRADEVFAVARRRHRAARVAGIGTRADDR